MNFDPLYTFRKTECKNSTTVDEIRTAIVGITSVILIIFLTISYITWELPKEPELNRGLLLALLMLIYTTLTTPKDKQ